MTGKEKKYRRDIETLKQTARFLIVLDQQGKVEKLVEKENWKLNVIAVIGIHPKYGEIVLFELGIGATRPYHNSRNEEGWINDRRKDFFLSEEQYLSVRPIIFGLMRKVTQEKMMGWKKIG